MPFPTSRFIASIVPLYFGLWPVAGLSQSLPAFPGAEGAGAYAKGGRGGDVYHVTNLNSSGAGSLAEGLATAPSNGRTIVFDVSGHIHIPVGSRLRITTSKITIAGQTAPGDGVGLKDATFWVSGDDIVVRHLRFRYGKQTAGGDAVDLDSGSSNVVFDHCSVQFGSDENFSTWSPPENLTFQWSLNAWGLESHSCGGLWNTNHATVHHSLWAHNHTRNPKARPEGMLDWVNNITFDWDIGFIMGDSETPASWKANVMSSYFVCPPGNLRSVALEKANLDRNGSPNFSLYLDDCLMDANGNGILDVSKQGYALASGSYVTAATPFSNTGAAVMKDPALLAYKKVLSNAGALRLEATPNRSLRDDVDAKLINNVLTQTRNHISSESQLGLSNGGYATLNALPPPPDTDRDGMPDYWETAIGLNPASDDHNGQVPASAFIPNTPAGYTHLEEYLHFKASPHGTVARRTSTSSTSLDIDLQRYTAGFAAASTFTIANPTNGTAVLQADGRTVKFTPNLDYFGRARFDFTVNDGVHTWTQRFHLIVTSAAQPSNLKWLGGQNGNAWDTTTNNWLNGTLSSKFGPGDSVRFDDDGSLTPSVAIANTVSPGNVTVNASGNYTFSGSGGIASTGTLTKDGAGTLTIGNTGSNGFLSGALENGSLVVNSTNGVGTGSLTLNSGTLQAGADLTNPLVINGDIALKIIGTRSLSGAWSGGGSIAPLVTGTSTFSITGNITAFGGAIAFGASSGFFRLNGSLGSPAASFDLGTGALSMVNRNGNATFDVGALNGGANTRLSGASSVAAPTTYRIGSNGLSSTFAGGITNGLGTTAIEKVGPGTLTLSGASTHSGTTLVSAGTLRVNGSLSASPVTVASGAILSGSGTIGALVTAQSGSILAPSGTLAVGSGFALNNPTLRFDLTNSPAGANDKITLNGGSLDLTGAIAFDFTLTDGTLGPGVYDLISGATTSTANGVSLTHNLPSGTRQSFALSRSAAGSNPSLIRMTVTGDAAMLKWTGATNGIWDTTTADNWTGATPNTFYNFDAAILDDTSINSTIAILGSVSPRSTLVNNTTKAFTIGGGSIGGAGSLTKSGAGTLTLSAANTHTGGTTIAGGIIQLANDVANAGGLSSGPITFAGGVLKMWDDSATYNDTTWQLIVPAGQAGTLWADSRCTISGSLSGAGDFTLRVPWIRNDWFCDTGSFSGRMTVFADADGGDFRFGTSYSWSGIPNGALSLNGKVAAYYIGTVNSGAGTFIPVGELNGTVDSILRGGVTAGRNFTYVIGGRNTDATFAGAIAEQNANTITHFVKTGSGIWALGGGCAWKGSTEVQQGTLRISGNVTCGGGFSVASNAVLNLQGGSVSADAIVVSQGAQLTGNGVINGDLNNDGTVLCGSGSLQVTGDVVNNGTMRFTSSAQLQAGGSFVNNGVLDLLTGTGSLPPNLENNGIVIDSRSLRTVQCSKTGASFSVMVTGYSSHSYQLQRSDSVAGPWENLGSAQAGQTQPNGEPTLLAFIDSAATGAQQFYRVAVNP